MNNEINYKKILIEILKNSVIPDCVIMKSIKNIEDFELFLNCILEINETGKDNYILKASVRKLLKRYIHYTLYCGPDDSKEIEQNKLIPFKILEKIMNFYGNKEEFFTREFYTLKEKKELANTLIISNNEYAENIDLFSPYYNILKKKNPELKNNEIKCINNILNKETSLNGKLEKLKRNKGKHRLSEITKYSGEELRQYRSSFNSTDILVDTSYKFKQKNILYLAKVDALEPFLSNFYYFLMQNTDNYIFADKYRIYFNGTTNKWNYKLEQENDIFRPSFSRVVLLSGGDIKRLKQNLAINIRNIITKITDEYTQKFLEKFLYDKNNAELVSKLDNYDGKDWEDLYKLLNSKSL